MSINLKKPTDGTVLVWPGTILKENEEEEFKEFLLDMGVKKVEILGTLITQPDKGKSVKESGGRNDLFFEVFNAKESFWPKRLKFGMRLLGDVLSNVNGYRDNPIYGLGIYNYLRDEDNFDLN